MRHGYAVYNLFGDRRGNIKRAAGGVWNKVYILKEVLEKGGHEWVWELVTLLFKLN